MSLTSRLAATGLLTLTAAATSLALAPSASAAEAPEGLTISSMSVAPGEDFTISGVDCLSPDDAEYEAAAFVVSENGDVDELAMPEEDGSWSLTLAFPDDMEAGEQLMVAGCSWYDDGWAYGEWTMTVEGGTVGAIRGVEANTPGTKAVSTDKTSTSSAPGQKVVRVIEGFQPHEVVTLVMHSTPVVLGTFTADANGVLTASFTLPAGAAVGTHTLVYQGTTTYFQESFTVTAAGKQLATTGADVTMPLTLGLGLVLAGAGALYVSRRKPAGALQTGAPQV